VATVYNGIDLTNITYTPDPGECLVFLGRIHPDKGTHLAIETAKKSGCDLIIAGIIQDQTYFDEFVEPHVNGSSVRFIGSVGPLERDALLKQACAVLHLNTIPERFGLVMAEAMAAGVPVIAMDLGSCREVVAENETGFLVNSVDQAVEAVGTIASIRREDCRRRVEDLFTIECMVAGYEKAYAEVFRRESLKSR
jgi:glycosyltransferase involved in cell wall biosynthesis